MDSSNLYVLHEVALWFGIFGARYSLQAQWSPDGKQVITAGMEGVWKMEQGGSKVVAFPHVNLKWF